MKKREIAFRSGRLEKPCEVTLILAIKSSINFMLSHAKISIEILHNKELSTALIWKVSGIENNDFHQHMTMGENVAHEFPPG